MVGEPAGMVKTPEPDAAPRRRPWKRWPRVLLGYGLLHASMAGSFSKIGCGGMDNPEHNPAATAALTTVRLLPVACLCACRLRPTKTAAWLQP